MERSFTSLASRGIWLPPADIERYINIALRLEESWGCAFRWSNWHSRAYLCFLLKSLFSFTFLPPPSVTLEAPSFHLSGTITYRLRQLTVRSDKKILWVRVPCLVSLTLLSFFSHLEHTITDGCKRHQLCAIGGSPSTTFARVHEELNRHLAVMTQFESEDRACQGSPAFDQQTAHAVLVHHLSPCELSSEQSAVCLACVETGNSFGVKGLCPGIVLGHGWLLFQTRH